MEHKKISHLGIYNKLFNKKLSHLGISSLKPKGRGLQMGFTLVELIVVVTILAILSAIGFVAYSGYMAGVRDTNRVSQLKSISDGLELYRTKHTLPTPNDYVEVKSDSKVIAYQGYVGKGVLEAIEYSSEGVEPKDGTYFSYYLTKDKKYYQLMAFLEEDSNLQNKQAQIKNKINLNKTFALDYSNRYPTVYGKKLGILTNADNTPIQEIDTIKTNGLDVKTATGEYIGHFSDSYNLKGTGSTLIAIENMNKAGGTILGSCKKILDKKTSLKGKDGIYIIDPEGGSPFSVYCDMTTDGGGWTKVAYSSDLEYKRQFSGGDGWKWLPNNFTFNLTNEQINSIRKVSTEAKQKYVGLCNGVIHYYYNSGNSYSYAFGFRFHTGLEQNGGVQNYGNGINVIQDGCKTNGGEGGNFDKATIFEINNIALPIINIKSSDNGDGGEEFGSLLKNNPAWFR